MSTTDPDIISDKSRIIADTAPPPPVPPPPEPPASPTISPLKSPALVATPLLSRAGSNGGISGENATTSTNNTANTASTATAIDSNNNNSALLSPPLLVEIEEGTPAAEALKANADVRVSKLRKVGRSTRLQAGVRVLKSAARTASGQPGHAGDRRGAPAFVPPAGGSVANLSPGANNLSANLSTAVIAGSGSGKPPPTIPEVDDEESEQGVLGSPRHAAKTTTIIDAADGNSSVDGEGITASLIASQYIGLGDDYDSTTSQEGNQTSIVLDDSSTDRNSAKPLYYGGAAAATNNGAAAANPAEVIAAESILHVQHPAQRQSMQHVTHAALPAAVAAACFAGEALDRKRADRGVDGAASIAKEESASDLAHKSPLMSPFTNLFKSTTNLSAAMDDMNATSSPIRINPRPGRLHKRAVSVPGGRGVFQHGGDATPISVFRRTTVDHAHRTSMDHAHNMPSEISVAETEKHANLRATTTSSDQVIEDLSDDEMIEHDNTAAVETTTTTTAASPGGKVQIKKHVEVSPIVVEIPGAREEETKDDEERRMFGDEGEPTTAATTTATKTDGDHHREALMAKAKKKISRRSTKKKSGLHDDDDAFHFHGHKSVRKWVNKRRSKDETKNQRSYVKGKVIDGKHELYTMSIAVMFGMRTSIGRTNLAMSQTAHNERRWLDNDDLMAVEKYEFPPRGSDMTPPHQLNHTFKFKDYSPLAFAYLRRMFGVNEYDFLLSVCGNANYIEFQSNAKSGQFFFYSPDGKYMIKTMTNTECKFLRRILPHYFRHCAKNPNTLITKFLGMYRVKLYHLKRNVKFVVMKSVYDTDKYLNQLFDVKGSTTGRDAKPTDAVKKDNDIRRMLPDGAFILEPGLRERLKVQVEHDCQFLTSMKIMDYSMLIGVHNIAHRNTKMPLSKAASQPPRAFSTDDGDDRSNSSYDASNATLDRFLDVDDDDSYLDGYHQKSGKSRVAYESSSTSDDAVRTVRVLKTSDNVDDETTQESRKETDAPVEKAIEDMYWPFHRFYDIQGLRRMKPIRESLLAPETPIQRECNECDQVKDESNPFFHFLFGAHAPMTSGGTYDLPAFERPLSHRKDGGFMMDTSALDLPLKMSVPGAPHMSEYCDGKIFYMGIIDILQQFNIRKRFEARYRRLGGKGWEAASCVHPNLYGDRFLRFFEEYTEGAETNEPAAASPITPSAKRKNL